MNMQRDPGTILGQTATAAPRDDGARELRELLEKPYSAREVLLPDKLASMMKIAEFMASGKVTVPPHLRGNVGDCMAIVSQAMAWNANPWGVAQKTHLVNDTLGYESQLIGAVLNASGAIVDSALHDEYFGAWDRVVGNYRQFDSRYKEADGTPKTYRKLATTLEDERGVGIRVWATLAGESEPRALELLLTQAQVRNSTLWADDPKQQLFYLAQKRWARKYAPGVILGLYSPDELESTGGDDMLGAPPPPPPKAGPQRRSQAAQQKEQVPPPEQAPPPGPVVEPASAPAPANSETGEIAAPNAAPSAAERQSGAADEARPRITDGQVAYLRGRLKAAGKSEAEEAKRFAADRIEDLNVDAFDVLKSELIRGNA